jgi:hypothetical protein
MVKKLCYIILLLGTVASVRAQKDISADVQVWSNIRLATFHSGWDAGWNGAGLAVGVQRSLKKNFRGLLAGEAGAAGVGNYVAGKAGLSIPIQLGSSRWAYTPGFNLLQGMTLTRPHPLYMWGVEQTNTIGFRLNNTSGPGLVLAFRLYGFPGYIEFSEVNSFVDLTLGVRYTF